MAILSHTMLRQQGCCVRILVGLITFRDTYWSTRRQRTPWHICWNDCHRDLALEAQGTSSSELETGLYA
ncbi:hypothetical protein CFP56_035324 [Quercus suber]|uniref:Uncharacterized protein n=1 Tax=Quercus suber TaxID=58331 RepID=A0AAW0JBM2_QUESU